MMLLEAGLTELTDLSDVTNLTEELTSAPKLKLYSLDEIKAWLTGLAPGAINILLKIIIAIVVLLIGIKVIGFIRKLLRRALTKADADNTVIHFLDSLLKIFLYFILIVAILNQFGLQTTSVVAVLGSVGLAAGLALQGSLSNFAGGVLILMLKPFRAGDYIKEDAHGNEGTVTGISIFYTHLKTADNNVIVIPNGSLANSSMTNYTQEGKRRINLLIGIAYDADLKKAKEILSKVLTDETERLMDEDPQVVVNALNDSSVELAARIWVKPEQYWTVYWRLMENVKLAFDENDIEIPFNQIDIKIKQ